MKKIYFLLLAIIIGFAACNNEDDPKPDPTISFLTSTGYTFEDANLEEGDSIFIGIKAVSNGSDKLVSLEISVYNQTVDMIELDDLQVERTFIITKGAAPEEEWTFEVTDNGGKTASVSITFTRVYGSIVTNNSVVLGAQNNSTSGSFYSTEEDDVYMQGAAFTNQELIDIIYYYDATDLNTLASPGANIGDDVFTGTSGLANWTTLNETFYYKTSISVAQFDAVTNDSLISISYNNEESKRKAKNLAVGDVYSFKTAAGKLGLIKIIAVNGEATGDLEFAIKMED